MISGDTAKNASALSRLWGHWRHPTSVADFFTYSPWSPKRVMAAYQRVLIPYVCAGADATHPIFIAIDDSLAKKPKTSRHFEAVDWHFDSCAGRGYGHGVGFVTIHITCGKRSAPAAWALYVREKTIRRLNRRHRRQQNPVRKLSFRSKQTIVRQSLREIEPYLPPNAPVFILFDSWYASVKLIRFCRRRPHWHLIGAVKSNRCLNDRKLSAIARRKRTKSLRPVTIGSANNTSRYWTWVVSGYLRNYAHEVRVTISKRHKRDPCPQYLFTTDVELSVKTMLTYYLERWVDEVDHWYLKVPLGLEDFRIRTVEGLERFLCLSFLALAYLYWRQSETDPRPVSLMDVLRTHKQDQYRKTLEAFGKAVLRAGQTQSVLNDFMPVLR